MIEIRTDPRTAQQAYRELPPADKAVFKTILDLAMILLKPQTAATIPEPEPKKEETHNDAARV